jgi:hypothetical protein
MQFNTDDVVIEKRPQGKIKIGSGTYTVTAPKTDVWRETFALLSKVDLARELVADSNLDPEDAAQRDALLLELADVDRLEEAIITGRVEYDGPSGTTVGIKGGFLRRALGEQQWEKVRAEWKDDASDLDLDALFKIADIIQDGFGDWYVQRQNITGLPEAPKAQRASARKATARRVKAS